MTNFRLLYYLARNWSCNSCNDPPEKFFSSTDNVDGFSYVFGLCRFHDTCLSEEDKEVLVEVSEDIVVSLLVIES